MPFAVISYDVTDDRRRARVARKLLDYGTRVQYSVFECSVSEDTLKRVLAELEQIIEPAEDSVRCYRLCRSCAVIVQVLGEEKGFDIDSEYLII